MTVKDVANFFLTDRMKRVDTHEITPEWFSDYLATITIKANDTAILLIFMPLLLCYQKSILMRMPATTAVSENILRPGSMTCKSGVMCSHGVTSIL